MIFKQAINVIVHGFFGRFSAISFSDDTVLRFGFSDFSKKQDYQSAVNATRFVGGRTNIADAIQMMVGKHNILLPLRAGKNKYFPTHISMIN